MGVGKRDFDSRVDDIVHLLGKINDDPLSVAHLFKILSKSGKLVPFEPTSEQSRLSDLVHNHRWVLDLKPRQIGSTTVLAYILFIKSMLNPGYRSLIVAQGHDAATKIFKMVHTFYETAPEFLKVPIKEINKTTIEFRHKGSIRVTSANSNSVRGSTYNAVLGSEVAFWPDPESTVASVFQAVASDSDTIIVLESTPNMVNYFYTLWSRTDHGLHKFFSPWTEEKTYVLDAPEAPVTPEMEEYAREHGLTEQQKYWAAQALAVKCLGRWDTFKQEYAIDPESCFIQSGDSVFNFPADWLAIDEPYATGWKVFEKPNPASMYSIGVDPASGSATGDFAAITVMDVSNLEKPIIVATWQDRISPKKLRFVVRDIYAQYPGTVIVDRTGGWGVTLCEELQLDRIPQYLEIKKDLVDARAARNFGFNINAINRGPLIAELQHVVNNNILDIPCPRLRYQMARYIYKDNRPDHQDGEHDDLIFSTALSLTNKRVARDNFKSTTRPMPASHDEIAKWERVYGKTFNDLLDMGVFNNGEDNSFGGW